MMNLSSFRPVYAGLLRRLNSTATYTVPNIDKGSQNVLYQPPRPKEPVLVSKLNNGLTVASLETHTPTARVGLIVNAGSRYETNENLGLTHCLRSCAHLTTKNATTFSITRGLDDIGAKLEAATTRDHMIYSVQCLRQHLEQATAFLKNAVTGQEFRPWEVKDNRARVILDLAGIRDQLQYETLESLHSASFRNTLGHSLFASEYAVGKIDSEMLLNYVNTMYTADNMVLVGVGVDHSDLKAYGETFDVKRGETNFKEAAKFSGGEIRTRRDSPYSCVAVAVEGASLSSPDSLALGILQHLMGAGPYVKWGSQTATSKLSQVATKATSLPVSAGCFNLSYSDSGLYGMFVITSGDEMSPVLKAMMSECWSISQGQIPDKEFTRAKNQLKTAVLMNLESQSSIFEDIGVQVLETGKHATEADLIVKIDAVTAQQVASVAKRISTGKMSMAATGNIGNTPYLDELS